MKLKLVLFEECSFKIADHQYVTFLLQINLKESGGKKILPSGLPSPSQNKLQSCDVDKVDQMSPNGFENVSDHTFRAGRIGKKDFDMTVSAQVDCF